MAKLKREDYLKFTKERLAELLVENNKAKLKKEDYLKLSRERLAELLVELDSEPTFEWWINPNTSPYKPWTTPNNPWIQPYTDGTDISGLPDCCKPGGVCKNPFGDCVNCPKRYPYTYGYSTSSTADVNKMSLEKIVDDINTRGEFNSKEKENVEQK
jgi:hypothetical protein